MQNSEVPPPEQTDQDPVKWRVPLWPVPLLLVLGLLAWDWKSYFTVLRVRKELGQLATPGKAVSVFESEVRAQGATIDNPTSHSSPPSSSRAYVSLTDLGIPRSLLWPVMAAEKTRYGVGVVDFAERHFGPDYHLVLEVDSSGSLVRVMP